LQFGTLYRSGTRQISPIEMNVERLRAPRLRKHSIVRNVILKGVSGFDWEISNSTNEPLSSETQCSRNQLKGNAFPINYPHRVNRAKIAGSVWMAKGSDAQQIFECDISGNGIFLNTEVVDCGVHDRHREPKFETLSLRKSSITFQR
jgi:hypothetical protein